MFPRKTTKFLIFAFVLLIAGGTSAAATTPEQTAKGFYIWYLKELNAERDPIEQKQTLLKSVSKRLGKWIYSPKYEEYGADYFIDAQDWDKKWQVTTTKAVVKGNTATLKVTLAAPKAKADEWKQTLSLKLIKENGAWKIDTVNIEQYTT